ncbi:MAG: flagellar hook-basal body protein [Planctomycetota bacterium]
MPKGVYAAASAMLTERHTVEVLGNNIANATTPGFRRSIALRDDFASLLQRQARTGGLAGDGGAGVLLQQTYLVQEDGPLVQTGGDLDIALQGDGYFLVADERGDHLTRQSHYSTDAAGRMVTDDGRILQGQGGPVVIPPAAADVDIDSAGRIYAVMPTDEGPQRAFLDQIRVVTVPDRSALRGDDGVYFRPADQELRDAEMFSVHHHFVEHGNVQAVHEMVDMVAAQRRYDAARRLLTEQVDATRGYSDLLGGSRG